MATQLIAQKGDRFQDVREIPYRGAAQFSAKTAANPTRCFNKCGDDSGERTDTTSPTESSTDPAATFGPIPKEAPSVPRFEDA